MRRTAPLMIRVGNDSFYIKVMIVLLVWNSLIGVHQPSQPIVHIHKKRYEFEITQVVGFINGL